MTKPRMTCPRCGRDVAATVVRGPRVNAGKPIPAIRVPVRHKCEPEPDPFALTEDVERRGPWRDREDVQPRDGLL